MAKYEDVQLVRDDLYDATVVPESFVERLKLAYMIIFHSSKIRCKMQVSKLWFDANITDKDIENMTNNK